MTSNGEDLRVAWVTAALWHGPIEPAESLRRAHPEIAGSDIHTAAILGDAIAVRQFLSRDPAVVSARSAPYGGDPLTYLCLSRYLRLDPVRESGFLRAAEALLDAGADPNSGFWTTGEYPERETALYGAAGVARNEPLTRLLIARGADPNDDEAAYHSPEGYDLGAMKVLVETGRLTADNLAMMLIRKHDWHDFDGVEYLLDRGVNPNTPWRHNRHPLHHAISRDNRIEILKLLLDRGADPGLVTDGETAVALAARRGRGDLLAELHRRGIPAELDQNHRLIGACALGDEALARTIAGRDPKQVALLLTQGGRLLGDFACTGNAAGIRLLLDLGIPTDATHNGDGYFDIAVESTALHIAAWRLRGAIVRLLIARGANVNARDGEGRTPLALAIKGCVDSYWTERRTADPVRALLEAGASPAGIALPTGYDEVDAWLHAHGADV